MAVKLGYGGVANTNGARDFTGKETADTEGPFRSRTNNFNRRRFGGLWYPYVILFFWMVT